MWEVKDLEKLLAFIEDETNYIAAFSHVFDYCIAARERNNQLWADGIISDNEKLRISERIALARSSAIKKHKEYVIRHFERTKTEHTVQTFVNSIYNDIFG